jgi:hypothetical protein
MRFNGVLKDLVQILIKEGGLVPQIKFGQSPLLRRLLCGYCCNEFLLQDFVHHTPPRQSLHIKFKWAAEDTIDDAAQPTHEHSFIQQLRRPPGSSFVSSKSLLDEEIEHSPYVSVRPRKRLREV